MPECINGPHIIESCENCLTGIEPTREALKKENETLRQRLIEERAMRLWDAYFSGGTIMGDTWVCASPVGAWLLSVCGYESSLRHVPVTSLRLMIPSVALHVLPSP